MPSGLESVVNFLYLGETRIPHDQVNDFLKVAKDLQICEMNFFSELADDGLQELQDKDDNDERQELQDKEDNETS